MKVCNEKHSVLLQQITVPGFNMDFRQVLNYQRGSTEQMS